MEVWLPTFNSTREHQIHFELEPRHCRHNVWNIYIEIDDNPGFPVFDFYYSKMNAINKTAWPPSEDYFNKYSKCWKTWLYCYGCGYVKDWHYTKQWTKKESEKFNKKYPGIF